MLYTVQGRTNDYEYCELEEATITFQGVKQHLLASYVRSALRVERTKWVIIVPEKEEEQIVGKIVRVGSEVPDKRSNRKLSDFRFFYRRSKD